LRHFLVASRALRAGSAVDGRPERKITNQLDVGSCTAWAISIAHTDAVAAEGTMKAPSALFALVLLSAPDPCLAWGAEGHRIVAAIAADELSPPARAEVARLLGTDDAAAGMVAVSTWADEIRRQRPNTAPWHFVDIPVQATAYDRGRDCQGDDCVVAQIEGDTRIVADRQLAPPVRAEALRFLIHFVGDIHQPLHDADNSDRGGNSIRVVVGKRHSNMHAVWDVDVVRALGRNPDEVAARLEHEITPAEKQLWSGSRPADWANEGHRLARDEIYTRIFRSGR
jgi:hypothetical protein